MIEKDLYHFQNDLQNLLKKSSKEEEETFFRYNEPYIDLEHVKHLT